MERFDYIQDLLYELYEEDKESDIQSVFSDIDVDIQLDNVDIYMNDKQQNSLYTCDIEDSYDIDSYDSEGYISDMEKDINSRDINNRDINSRDINNKYNNQRYIYNNNFDYYLNLYNFKYNFKYNVNKLQEKIELSFKQDLINIIDSELRENIKNKKLRPNGPN